MNLHTYERLENIMTTATNLAPPERKPELLGQTAVVIGGSAGIGLETAHRARAEGADVILTGRDPERLAQAALDVGARSTRLSTPTITPP
jgi:NADP-dependent 3-hydroxy acid dehydrogenase YdfG